MNKLEELELKILREAVDKAEERQKKRAVKNYLSWFENNTKFYLLFLILSDEFDDFFVF